MDNIPRKNKSQFRRSHSKVKFESPWEKVKKAFNSDAIIKCKVIKQIKGGFIVDCSGQEAFLPGSQLGANGVFNFGQYIDKVLDVKVIKVSEVDRNVVVSHKALIKQDKIEEPISTVDISEIEVGFVIETIVKNIMHFGAILTTGQIDGLLYLKDITWGRIGHPSELLEINQRIKVVVLDFDERKKKISFGLKQLTPHPWDIVTPEVIVGSIIHGKVVVIEDYGVFVEIYAGLEGLIHISEITWGQANVVPKEYFKLGQELEAKVLSVDLDERKIALSVKQLTEDPWLNIDFIYPVGRRSVAKVKNLTNYGVFVEFADGITGMVHISDFSWVKRYAHPSGFTKVGNDLEVVILEVNHKKRQISLGHKQILPNPWDSFEAIFQVGSYHEGTCLTRNDKGATFLVSHDLEAFAPAKHIRKEDNSVVEPGEIVTVKVIEFNRDERRILVSHLRYIEDVKRNTELALKKEPFDD